MVSQGRKEVRKRGPSQAGDMSRALTSWQEGGDNKPGSPVLWDQWTVPGMELAGAWGMPKWGVRNI